MSTPSEWSGILDEGEAILWQGRPGTGLILRPYHAFSFLFGAAFAGFALFWMVMASQAGGVFWMFGLIHFFAGIAIAIGPPVWSAWTRNHTWYTLTDRRAFIATDLPFSGRRLKSYELGSTTPIDFEPGDPATIYFAHEYRRTKNGSRRVDIGFQQIESGEEVYRKIREAQRQIAASEARE